MAFKFERLDVWRLALEYCDTTYALASQLPRAEEFNLKSQIMRAATSVALNIAEGSTGQTNAEQARFVGLAIRSAIETVACQDLIQRRGYVLAASLAAARTQAEVLVVKLQAFRRSIAPDTNWLRDETPGYDTTTE